MSAASRNRELAADLARRTERMRADEAAGEDVAERLRAAAGDDGRLSVDEAVGVLGGEEPPATNPIAEQLRAKWSRTHELSRRYEPESHPPAGDVDAGKGDAGSPPRTERVGDQEMEVLDVDRLMNQDKRED